MKLETVTTQQCEGVVGWCHAVAAPFMCANGIVYVLGGNINIQHRGRAHMQKGIGNCQQHSSKQDT